VTEKWLDIILSLVAAPQPLDGAASTPRLLEYARARHSPAPTAAVLALILACPAPALQAVFFLSQTPLSGAWPRLLATVFARLLLAMLASTIALPV
jgi:hypothetical protein